MEEQGCGCRCQTSGGGGGGGGGDLISDAGLETEMDADGRFAPPLWTAGRGGSGLGR